MSLMVAQRGDLKLSCPANTIRKYMDSEFIRRNVTISGRRTSLRLESAIWQGLEEICRREKIGSQEICNLVENHRDQASRTSAIRIFVVNYFRMAARSNGSAGSGVNPGQEGDQSVAFNVAQILRISADPYRGPAL